MAVPNYAKLSKFEDINYLCNIRDKKDVNVKFLLDKGVIILQNCYTDGKLINISIYQYFTIIQQVLTSLIVHFSIKRCSCT